MDNLPFDIQSLPHTWRAPMEPERVPFLTIPSLAIGSTLETPSVDLYFLSVAFWLELVLITICLFAMNALVGIIVYHFCVNKSKTNDSKSNPGSTTTTTTTTTTAYLVGYGVVMPFWSFFAYASTSYLGVQNKIYRMAFVVLTTIPCFRTTAAVHSCLPPHATRSMLDFCFYYACPMAAQYDEKTQQYQRATYASIAKRVLILLNAMMMAGLIASLFYTFPSIFPPLTAPPQLQSTSMYSLAPLLQPSNIWSNICRTAFLQFFLNMTLEGVVLIQVVLTGIDTPIAMNNPVFSATSVGNFWGRKWNMAVQDVLKRGVYLPVRNGFGSAGLGKLATFAASGFIHEWLLLTLFPSYDNTPVLDGQACQLMDRDGTFSPLHCYRPQYGSTLAFFVWQAMLILVENLAYPYCKGIMVHVPNPIKTLLTLVAGGCVAHWFFHPYVHSTFFLDGECALLMWKLKDS